MSKEEHTIGRLRPDQLMGPKDREVLRHNLKHALCILDIHGFLTDEEYERISLLLRGNFKDESN